ncbi:hypothetical protein BDEG_21557 [Batrachochytrium dendrobatidis JEL423]|uniref:Zf-CHY-domain-containing protein n=2 Tax=Batrachochytrium dendrobatidis TaxID=109871 RepID=A0A177WBR7_BATDL|nr:hypothetical protein BDEG_21557 [Batrachochytrium dendrobatidis JEL423]
MKDNDVECSPLDLTSAQQRLKMTADTCSGSYSSNRPRQFHHGTHVCQHGSCSSRSLASSSTAIPTQSVPQHQINLGAHCYSTELEQHTSFTHASIVNMYGTTRLDTQVSTPHPTSACGGSHAVTPPRTIASFVEHHNESAAIALTSISTSIHTAAQAMTTSTIMSATHEASHLEQHYVQDQFTHTAREVGQITEIEHDDEEVDHDRWEGVSNSPYGSDVDMDEDYYDDDDEEALDDYDESESLEEQPEDKTQSFAQVVEQQGELRKQIQLIQADTNISSTEKARCIQELMTKKWTSKQQIESSKEVRNINRLADKKFDFDKVTEEDKVATYHAPNIMGCKHYQRCTKLQAHCCGKWDTCRFCHDEVSDHTIVRSLVVTMMCMFCNTVQPAGQDCTNLACGKRVARYYCKECKLWDDDPRKTIYHCHDCGICRIGKGLGIDYFHCPTCNVCMAIGLKGRHKCIERNLESDCPICGEYMFTSTSTVIFMPCGHCMHHKCHQQYTQTSYQCPTCLKSLADMTDYFKRVDESIALHKMPEEYSNTFSFIYCNDCEKKSYAYYHFLYHKCGHCNGYNTKLLQTREGLPADAVIAKKVTEEILAAASSPVEPVAASPASQTLPSEQSQDRLSIVSAIHTVDQQIENQLISSQNSFTSTNELVATRQQASFTQLSSSSNGSTTRSFWCHHCQLSQTF